MAAVHWLAMLSPGPNVLLVAQTAMSRSRAAAVAAALGVATGAALLATAAMVGLALAIEQSSGLRHVLQAAGGCYLVYLGARMWGSAGPGAPDRVAAGRHFLRGLLTNLSNPKAAVFFGSVLTATLGAGVPGWVRVAAVILIALDAAAWHCLVAVLFARPGVRRAYARRRRAIDRVAGAALAAVGVVFALTAL